MRRKLPVLLLALIILLQVFVPAVYAASKNEAISSTPPFCSLDTTPEGAGKVVHGNSKLSTKTQHGYEIFEKETGDVVKTGISGRPLNKNGTSSRANSQVNSFNNAAGSDKYGARVVAPSIPGRQAALDWELNNAMRLWGEGNSMGKHLRPQPWK